MDLMAETLRLGGTHGAANHMSGAQSKGVFHEEQPKEEEEEEEDDEEVSDNPLPVWMEGDSLAPPCQADMDVVKAIIDFAEVTQDDVLYDLGCGDGRICIAAAESRGAKACGVEIEEDLADKFRRRVTAKGLESKVSVIHGDLRDINLSDATVVVMYLLPEAVASITQSHLLPLLLRGQSTPPADDTNLSGHDSRRSRRKEMIVGGEEESQEQITESGRVVAGEVEGLTGGGEGQDRRRSSSSVKVGGGGTKPCRIVCNTWGIPGATAVREAGVGLNGGVKLRLFTHESLPAGTA